MTISGSIFLLMKRTGSLQDDFGKTEMGRDLLAQDYILKQITASLIYPENRFGEEILGQDL